MAERNMCNAAWVGEFVRAVMDALEDHQFPTGTVEFDMAVDWGTNDGCIRNIMPAVGRDGVCRLRFSAVRKAQKEKE